MGIEYREKVYICENYHRDIMRRIFLVGYMGAGKTTVGKRLSRLAGLSFIDLDYYIEGRYHKSVSDLFAEKGEEAFREIERKMLHEIAEFEDVLISTGGGTPCFFDNMQFMNSHGKTIYLEVSVDELASRLEICKHTRPVLKNRSGDDLKSFIAESLEKRRGYYEMASVSFNVDKMLTESDVDDISVALMKII